KPPCRCSPSGSLTARDTSGRCNWSPNNPPCCRAPRGAHLTSRRAMNYYGDLLNNKSPQENGMAIARENWSARSGFIFAAVGSALGLGNIWRFPYVAYENGGGAFLIPYLIALVTASLPLLFLDYNIGHKYKGAAPLAYRRMHKYAEAIGWWQVTVCVFVGLYYASVLSWAGSYMVFSFGQ